MSDISACYIFLGDLVNAKRFNLLAGKSNASEFNNGIIQLILGNYHEGWKGYDSGILNNSRDLRNGYEKFDELPEWNPDIHFDSVVLIGEQGIGDEIMYSTIIGCLFLNFFLIK